jgi:hypothetical protein
MRVAKYIWQREHATVVITDKSTGTVIAYNNDIHAMVVREPKRPSPIAEPTQAELKALLLGKLNLG